MVNALAAKFQKIVVFVPTVLTSLNLADETLKSNAASEFCANVLIWTKICCNFEVNMIKNNKLFLSEFSPKLLNCFTCVQDEEVSEFAVDAFKDVSSEARQRKERKEKEQTV